MRNRGNFSRNVGGLILIVMVLGLMTVMSPTSPVLADDGIGPIPPEYPPDTADTNGTMSGTQDEQDSEEGKLLSDLVDIIVAVLY